MIRSIRFENYRNLNREYRFTSKCQIIFGENNSGKTNLLDGIRLAFSAFTEDYVKVKKSDFADSDDSKIIEIYVELNPDSIPTLNFYDQGVKKCGFKVEISKTGTGRYKKRVCLLSGSPVDMEILREDDKVPTISVIPLVRSENIYSEGLITGITHFIESEEKYQTLISESKDRIKSEMGTKIKLFQDFCKKFDQELDIELTEPRVSDERAYVVDGKKEHNYCIGSGYKSVANIILNTLNEGFNIILIDEIENNLHPALIRTLLREIRKLNEVMIIATTHSPVIVNEANIDELLDIKGARLVDLEETIKNKLNTFLHPGRAEVVFSNNVILVEGYTEEMLIRNYLHCNNYNWTIVNVAGIMFEPYIKLAKCLGKRTIVVSDNDCATNDNKKTTRFTNLESLCKENDIKIIEVDNTLESDLYKNGYLSDCTELLKRHDKNPEFYVAKQNKKTEIARTLIENNVDLSKWHVIKEIKSELGDY